MNKQRYFRDKGQHKQAIGRLRGGLTTKIHAIFDALGNLFQFELTPRQAHDSVKGYEILSTLALENREVLADQAYDTDAIRGFCVTRTQSPR